MPWPGQAEARQDLPVGEREVVLGERGLHAPLDPAADAVDAVDDPLHLEVDADPGERLEPAKEAVDVVFVGHGRHGARKCLDVKTLLSYSLDIEIFEVKRLRQRSRQR